MYTKKYCDWSKVPAHELLDTPLHTKPAYWPGKHAAGLATQDSRNCHSNIATAGWRKAQATTMYSVDDEYSHLIGAQQCSSICREWTRFSLSTLQHSPQDVPQHLGLQVAEDRPAVRKLPLQHLPPAAVLAAQDSMLSALQVAGPQLRIWCSPPCERMSTDSAHTKFGRHQPDAALDRASDSQLLRGGRSSPVNAARGRLHVVQHCAPWAERALHADCGIAPVRPQHASVVAQLWKPGISCGRSVGISCDRPAVASQHPQLEPLCFVLQGSWALFEKCMYDGAT